MNENIDIKEGIIQNQGVYRHFDAHSDVSALTEEELVNKLENAYARSRDRLLRADVLIITLGTSIVFKHHAFKDIVANCHKIPGKDFDLRFLNPDEILQSFDKFFRLLTSFNKDVKIILTVSPVRHLRSTLEKNSVSKAILRLAVHKICEHYPGTEYFPSYEITLDDLREYRFFKADMVHPNEVAVDYIWEKFKQIYFNESTTKFIDEWKKITNAINHKPFNPESGEHQEFIRKMIRQLRKFEDIVDISEEMKILENQRI